MAIYKLARFEVRAGSDGDAERAMHELASRVRSELPDVMWTAYRDRAAPARFVALTRAETPAADARAQTAIASALAPFVAGAIEVVDCELVTSSDLGRRHRR